MFSLTLVRSFLLFFYALALADDAPMHTFWRDLGPNLYNRTSDRRYLRIFWTIDTWIPVENITFYAYDANTASIVALPSPEMHTAWLYVVACLEDAFYAWRSASDGALDFRRVSSRRSTDPLVVGVKFSPPTHTEERGERNHERFSSPAVLAHATYNYLHFNAHCKFMISPVGYHIRRVLVRHEDNNVDMVWEDDLFRNSSYRHAVNSFYDRVVRQSTHDLSIVATHEIGHVLGLGHASNHDSIMYYEYASNAHISSDDVSRIRRMFGVAQQKEIKLQVEPYPRSYFEQSDLTNRVAIRNLIYGFVDYIFKDYVNVNRSSYSQSVQPYQP